MIVKNKVYCMDALELLKQMPDQSVDLILTDPPYGIKYHSNRYKNGNPHNPINNDDTLFIPIDDLWRVLKPTGAMFVFFSHKVPLIDKRVKNVIIWVKNNWTAGDLYKDFGNQYECIAYMPKQGFKFYSKRFSNVWGFDRISADKLLHPTQKPIGLCRRIIESNKGNVVFDPFMGSGTTGIACKELGRDFIGIENISHHEEYEGYEEYYKES